MRMTSESLTPHRVLASRPHGLVLVGVSLLAIGSLLGCVSDPKRDAGETDSSPSAEATPGVELPASLSSRELAFIRPDGRDEDHIFVAQPDGSGMRQVEDGPGCKQRPIWSPDGQQIAYRFLPACDYNEDHVVIIDVEGGEPFDLSQAIGVLGNSPSWSPDGQQLAFSGMRVEGGRPAADDQPMGLYVASSDGTASRRLTPTELGEVQYPMWSPDGSLIAFQISRSQGFDIYTVRSDGSDVRQLTDGGGYNEWPMWSPDGSQIAYGVEGETSALWSMNADGSNPRQIVTGIGVPAAWAPGEWLVANCLLEGTEQIGICAVSPDGVQQGPLLGGIDAGFPAWRP